MSKNRRRSKLGIYIAILLLVFAWAVAVYFLILRRHVVLGIVTAFLTAVLLSLPAIYPRGVDVSRDAIVLRTYATTKVIKNYRVLKKFSTREIFDYVYLCPVGWRVSLWSLYAICSTAFGRATAFSTPDCSDLWLAVEAGGKKYVVCCEEKDREVCANA
ncbi:MAG: hypothetical protein QXP31_04365 [Pyrobaculum sp.]